MATNFSQLVQAFQPESNPCGDQLSDGRLFIVPLVPCNRVPTPVTLTVNGALAIGDEQLTVTTTSVTPIVLEAGRVIYLNATDTVTVAETVEFDSTAAPATVEIEASTVAAAAAATFEVIERLETLTAEDLSIDFNFDTEDSNKVRQGLRKNKRIVGYQPTISGSFFVDLDDNAVWADRYLNDAALAGREIYAYLTLFGGELTIAGPAIVTSFSMSNTANSLSKLSNELTFNDEVIYTGAYRALDATRQSEYNELRACLGLAALA